MARTDTLINFLTDVAAAIKAKKGDDTAIPAANFDTEITNLPSGGGEGSGDNTTLISLIDRTATSFEIPEGTTSIGNYVFNGCTSLTTAPTIPSSVTSMDYTFRGCSKLQGTIEINANPTYYSYCFLNAATEGSGLVVTGTSTILDEIIATKGTDNTKITNGN